MYVSLEARTINTVTENASCRQRSVHFKSSLFVAELFLLQVHGKNAKAHGINKSSHFSLRANVSFSRRLRTRPHIFFFDTKIKPPKPDVLNIYNICIFTFIWKTSMQVKWEEHSNFLLVWYKQHTFFSHIYTAVFSYNKKGHHFISVT